MKIAWFARFATATVFFAALAGPASAQNGSTPARSSVIPFSATIESIEFNKVPQATQKVILDRIGLHVGDTLSVDARQRIASELGKAQKGMTFSYKAGSKVGTTKLVISLDC